MINIDISKTVKAFKILGKGISLKGQDNQVFGKEQGEKQNQITKPCKIAEEITSFICFRNQLFDQA